MSSIFLSHSSKDNAIAGQVKTRLEDWGHLVFLDFDLMDGIRAGQDWEKELYAQLNSCSAVIVLCSQTSMASHWCFAEIAFAKALSKPVFPIKIDDAKVDPIVTAQQVIDAIAGWDQAYLRLEKGLLAAGLDPKGIFNWDGTRPPYPGLPAFQEQDAAIFFGRDKEIREGQALLNQLQQFGGPRLTLMLGASGSGKSSLMRAGLLPRIKRDQRWVVVEPFRPLKAPFEELAMVLSQRFAQIMETKEGTVTDAAHLRERIRWDEQEPKQSIDTFLDLIKHLREKAGLREAIVLLMIDQCEELLTIGANEEGDRFLAFLRAVLDREASRFMVLATLRSDFLGSFQDNPAMRGLRFKTFPVPQIAVDDFASVIEEPARVAGLELGPSLVQTMISDTKTADALPLLAFTLRDLYEGFGQDKKLTLEEYRDQLGRLEGCIARAAEAVLSAEPLSEEKLSDLRAAFLAMVRVNGGNQYAKQPVQWSDLLASTHDTLERFITARLLIPGGDTNGRTLEVAHEALFRAWPKFKDWIDRGAADLRLIDYAEETARRWHDTGCHFQELWRKDRAEEAQCALKRLKKTPSARLHSFLQPQQLLSEKLNNPLLSHQDRLLIGQKLAELNDTRPGVGLNADGVPDIVWVDIPRGHVKLGGIDLNADGVYANVWVDISEGQMKLRGVERVFPVSPFRIAKYPVTNEQFEAFLIAEDGYGNLQWWRDIWQIHEDGKRQWQEANCPREPVSWYEAIAFCRWLSAKTGTSIRLPTEWEWQQAATGGDPQREYPWEGGWDPSRCNSDESRLERKRATAVGIYPLGATKQGVQDMAGNVWEWCMNKYEEPEQLEALHIDRDNQRVIRGGSWKNEPGYLLASFRYRYSTDIRFNVCGFRLVQDIP